MNIQGSYIMKQTIFSNWSIILHGNFLYITVWVEDFVK